VNDIRKLPDALNKVQHLGRQVVDKAGQIGAHGRRNISRRAGLAAFVWMVLFFIARFSLESPAWSPVTRVTIALLPLPAFVWFLWAFVQGIREADELERRIQLEALAVAFPLTALLFMTLGLMQIAVPLSPDNWSYRHTWPLIYVFYFVGLMAARRRYL
jgi:hypothetical protein